MGKRERNLWEGIDVGVRKNLNTRDYRAPSFTQELSQRGVDAGDLAAPRIAASARLRTRGFPAWKFWPEEFIHSGTVDFLANLCGATKAFSRGSASGPGNGPQLLGCFRDLPRAFTCIRRAIPENTDAVDWLRRLYIDEPDNYSVRRAMTRNSGT